MTSTRRFNKRYIRMRGSMGRKLTGIGTPVELCKRHTGLAGCNELVSIDKGTYRVLVEIRRGPHVTVTTTALVSPILCVIQFLYSVRKRFCEKFL